ncbi:MAG: divalent metal cation transporter [Lentisphaeraceae bacterium]|nr:divalent metal cation transporter [Lentisphaeraceae bacterium]
MSSEENKDLNTEVMEPPKSTLGIIKHLGPGIIIAGSIVGSGELVATTLAGAQAGFTLLWLIILGCIIKVFVQVEFGRHTMIWSKTPMKALNDVPGPRHKNKSNWILWFWLIMTCLVIVQQGGILGAIGEACTMVQPLSEQGETYNTQMSQKINAMIKTAIDPTTAEANREAINQQLSGPQDIKNWAIGIAILTSILLFYGKFGLIQWVSTVLVFGFTLITIINLAMLQGKPDWAISFNDLIHGLSFGLPESIGGVSSMGAAMAAFGIIGVGAAELIQYPYWCLEKGYSKYTGKRDDSEGWRARAKGWIKILKIDAWTSMVVYTFSTIAFYLMGATVLGRIKLMPEKSNLVRTLGEMYVPVFGSWAQEIFVFGAVAVLYSTFFLAAAGMSRVVADGFGLFGFLKNDEESRMKWSRIISGIWPLMALGLYLFLDQAPATMILWSGITQAIMLPILGVAALYFRYKCTDVEELRPTKVWDVFLWISVAGMFAVGIWTACVKLFG